MSNLKPLTGGLIRAANDTYAGIALSDARPDELTIELGQLRSAIETVSEPVTFDAEPAAFRAALLSLAKDAHR